MRNCLFGFLLLSCRVVFAQDNYEIQVYGAPTMDMGATMFELHSNFTFGGQLHSVDGILPTHNLCHETIEITHGFTSWMETGFYLFNAIAADSRTSFVGSHIRPRVAVPDSWHWPFGASLSVEFGYQKLDYSTDDYTLEIRPIVDKTWRKLYFAFNPAFDKSLHGLTQNQAFSFSPAAKVSYSLSKELALGVEYFGSYGPVGMISNFQQQQHQLFLAIDVDVSPDWEFNAGYGLGFTNASDNDIFKMILGYKLHQGDKNKQPRLIRGCKSLWNRFLQ